jgi:asparagine synthase (glutamine-hydrolysing)
MPGLFGMISRRPAPECERLVQAMRDAMLQESFYISGLHSAPGLGVYAGWTALEKSFGAHQPFVNESRNVTLLFSGECFPDRAFKEEQSPGAWILRAYEEQGEPFLESLNGLFSGLLIDRRINQAFLFNDRYGFDRLYLHETDDAIYFASEAAPLLRVLPQLRKFDYEGVNQFLAVGCTLEGRTLFHGIHLLPAGSVWSLSPGRCIKRVYFSPTTWESQPVLTPLDFQQKFQATLSRIVPRYFASEPKLGIALTAGLDSRMVLACRPRLDRKPVCYTYGGQSGEMLDTRLASRVAHQCGMDHHVLRIGSEFFSNFGSHFDRTIQATSGCFGLLGAHEIYFNRLARQLAPVRLTGVCGGEVLREVCTFKPLRLHPELLNPEARRMVAEYSKHFTRERQHPVTFAAFQEIPWNIHGSLAACRSQVTFRTPYLDNELVALAYQAPATVKSSSASAVRLIEEREPGLAAIPTDMGLMGTERLLARERRTLFSKLTFKVDYLCNDGLPSSLSFLDPAIAAFNTIFGIPGVHKYLWYRRWLRCELAGYVREQLNNDHVLQIPFWNSSYIGTLAEDHISGRRNCLSEINTVLTLGAIQRLLMQN